MSFMVQILYTGEGGNARRFAAEMVSSGIVDRIRSAKGNLRYEYFFPMEDEQSVLLIDQWENQAALDAHHGSEVMQRILELRERYDLHMRVERYLPDGEGVPQADSLFIRP